MNNFRLITFSLLIGYVFSSCTKDDGIEYIPEDSIIVAKLNTEQIVKDALIDFANESNIFDDLMAQFPQYKDFANAGIDEMNKFYFFTQLQSVEKLNLGALVPIKDEELFKKFVENRFKAKIENQNSVDFVNISGKYIITWNKNIALFYYSEKLSVNLVAEAIEIINKNVSTVKNKGEVFEQFNESKDHVLIWVDNINNSLINKQLKDLNIPQDDFYSFTSVNFNTGTVDIQSKSHYKNEKSIFKNLLSNDKSIENLLISSGSEEPLFIASIGLNFKGLIEYLNKNEELYNNLQANVPFVNIKDFISMFSGDFLLTYNGVEEEMVQFYDEKIIDGILEVVADEKVVKTPFLTYAVGLNDSKKLIEMLNPFLGMIPYEFTKKSSEAIVFETDEEYYISLQNNIFFTGSSSKARKLIKKMNTQMNPSFKDKILQYPFYFYANIDGIAQSLKDKENVETMDLISSTFDNFELSNYSVDKNEINAGLQLKLKNDQNSLIELIKFYKLLAQINKNQIL